jgi:hypothetical protein
MGTVHKFKRPPKNERQFRGYRPKPPKPPRGPRWWQRSWVMWALLIAVAILLAIGRNVIGAAHAETFACTDPLVVDGDILPYSVRARSGMIKPHRSPSPSCPT